MGRRWGLPSGPCDEGQKNEAGRRVKRSVPEKVYLNRMTIPVEIAKLCWVWETVGMSNRVIT